MRCRDCINFKTSTNLEVSGELSPPENRFNSLKGTCGVNNSKSKAQDECRVGRFSPK